MKIKKNRLVPLAFLLSLALPGAFLAAVWPALAGPYRDSSHGNKVNRSSIDGKYTAFATGNCGHCHEQHASLGGSEPIPVDGAASRALAFTGTATFCVYCHDGSPAVKDVKTQITKLYSHPSGDPAYADRHTMGVRESGQNGAPFRGSKRHAECADCHEPHTAKAGIHSYNTTTPANNNLVSPVLLGTWGVEPSSEPAWGSANVSYTEVKPTVREYQLCFKCHSYYALQVSSGITNFTGPSGELITDQAMEFSRNNKSVHPVRTTLNNQTGSGTTKRLTTAQMKAPWNNSTRIGNQTMYCSDCHGSNETPSASVPAGPHGSTNKHMLSGANQEWPRASGNSDHLWTLNDVKNNRYSWSTRLLCAKCHPIYSGGNFLNNVHDKGNHNDADKFNDSPWKDQYRAGVPCVSCHTVVPHGSRRSRLIAYKTEPQPYTLLDYKKANINPNVIVGFKKASTPSGYDKKNCYIPNGQGCGDHNSNDGGYD